MVKKITKHKIIELFISNYRGRYYLRELASLLKKSHQTIKPYVEKLVKEGVLLKFERKNVVEYSLNFKDKKVYDYLVIAEKEKLIMKLEENALLRILFEKLSGFFKNNAFIIFGSIAIKVQKGSDIDLLVIGKSNVSKEIKEFEEIYNRRIHKIQVTDLDKLTSTLIKEVYKKHIIFNDTEKIIRFFGELHEQNRLV